MSFGRFGTAPKGAEVWRAVLKIRRIDIAFVVGLVAFLSQVLGNKSDRTIVVASLLLMGFPIAHRVDDVVRKNGDGI